ncbi:ATP-binding cassette domain-containing protein [Aestuariibius sp. 2305UL40-4]|uniref:ATP-binding cassette domain-containing protein n=1 Tax=Aestuariibius violaceus TaxID=3234132 RepID=UPI00345E975F
MIALRDVTLWPTGAARPVLYRANAIFGDRQRIGILAPAASGKTTIARLLCGIERPASGSVLSTGRVSWPLGHAGMLHPELTAADNLHHLARTIGEDPAHYIAFCQSFAALDRPLSARMKSFSPAERARLAYAASLAIRCDTYIADETITVGDAETRAKSEALLRGRLDHAGLIFLSRNARQLDAWCDHILLLTDGMLRPCPSAKVAQAACDLAAERRQNRKDPAHV